MSQGFIQLYRKILDEWFWSDSKLCHLMITLILEANHQLKEVNFQGKKRIIGIGEHKNYKATCIYNWNSKIIN